MKHIIRLTFISLILASCSGDKQQSVEDLIASEDLAQLRTKKAELDAQQQELTAQIKQLQDKIKELDPQEKNSVDHNLYH